MRTAWMRIALVLPLAACSALLPTANVKTNSAWQSYEEAEAALNHVIPFTTHRNELAALGLDPHVQANLTVLNYAAVLRRFVPAGVTLPAGSDKGLKVCLEAPSECTGIEIDLTGEHRQRIGSFWPDFFNFRRESHITGWNFNAIILLKGDLVVYRTMGGEPNADRQERSVNPLGPLQGLGDQTQRIR
ncbi:MAG: hypothetical protein JO142_06220 [Burkholderiales bacterium]|nr:hypothetical protein [Burkholderiales bacterium]